jgi:ADP-ribose pyrophosphatase YjhB (NUDIX family)
MKKFKKAVKHDGERCDVVYVPTNSFKRIPDELVLKAHAVCLCKDRLLLVNHGEWNTWGLPGGTREFGETAEQTLAREILEEGNCEVLSYEPISYQKVTSPSGKFHYRLQYLCNVRPLGDFVSDPAGSVRQITWIPMKQYAEYIEPREMRTIVLERAISIANTHGTEGS